MAASLHPYSSDLTQALTYLFESVVNGVALLREQMRTEFGLTRERVKHFQALSTALQEELLSLSQGSGQELLPGKPEDKPLLESVNTLVIDLQYEDIIGQILEHVEQTAKDIWEELQWAASVGKRKSNRKSIEYTWLPGLVEIIQLQIALFGLAEKEHQWAVQSLDLKLSALHAHALYLQEKGNQLFQALSARNEASSSKAAGIIRLSYELTAQANAVLELLVHWLSFYEVVHILRHYLNESMQQVAQLPDTRRPLPAVALLKLQERCSMESERLIYQRIFQPDLQLYAPSQQGTIEMF